jgi:hypothetical protein
LNRGLADLRDAIEMACIRPRELLGLPIPQLAAGNPAEFIALNWKPGAELKIHCLG